MNTKQPVTDAVRILVSVDPIMLAALDEHIGDSGKSRSRVLLEQAAKGMRLKNYTSRAKGKRAKRPPETDSA